MSNATRRVSWIKTKPTIDLVGMGAIGAKRTSTKYPAVRVHGPAHWCRGCWQPIAVGAALRALLAGATLVVKSDGKDRANGHARR
jgi:hypothetical protein